MSISSRELKQSSEGWRTPVVHEALRNLHQLAHAAIFGQTAWPADREKCESIWQTLADSGLTEESANGTIRYTEPSVTPELELLLACIGAIEPWEVPFFLKEHGYASEEEALEVWEAETEAEGLRQLQLLINRAYAKRFVLSISHH
jgi:hypothetical protein